MSLPSIDFETYSAAGYLRVRSTGKIIGTGAGGKGGLPVVGIAAYAEHPSTRILSLTYNLCDGMGLRIWIPETPNPKDLFDHIAAGKPLEAHNIAFEWEIWNRVAVPQLGWPTLPILICHCSAAKARRNGLPGGLDKAAAVIGTARKDPKGERLIRKLCRPHTPTKKRTGLRHTLQTAPEDFQNLYTYNLQDVVAETELSSSLVDLTPEEHKTYLLDRVINIRGVRVDTETLNAALDILDQAESWYTAQVVTATNGAVQSVSELEKIKTFLEHEGNPIANLQEETVTAALRSDSLSECSRQVLEARSQIGAASVKKLRSLKLQLSQDGRLREQYIVFGADRTRRWTSGGVQLQNLASATPKVNECEACGRVWGRSAGDTCPRCGAIEMVREETGWSNKAIEQAVYDIRTGSFEHVKRTWGNASEVLTGTLRSLFIASPGYRLICVDYSAIEAVVAACISRCQWRIDVFRTHGKIYEKSASLATGVSFEEILAHKKQTGAHHPLRNSIGKIRELGYAYGGWVAAAKQFGADSYFKSDEEIKQDILKWRTESHEIVSMWGGQFIWCGPGKWDYQPQLYGLEGAAIGAILNPGQRRSYLDTTYYLENDILHCELPSTAVLKYWRPRLVQTEDRLKRGPCWTITFEGYNTNPKNGPVGWIRMETWGGKLFENIVQAIAWEIQAQGLQNAERAGYPIVMHTHDEGTAEVPDDPAWSVQGLIDCLVDLPYWCHWYPIKAAGWEGYRFHK